MIIRAWSISVVTAVFICFEAYANEQYIQQDRADEIQQLGYAVELGINQAEPIIFALAVNGSVVDDERLFFGVRIENDAIAIDEAAFRVLRLRFNDAPVHWLKYDDQKYFRLDAIYGASYSYDLKAQRLFVEFERGYHQTQFSLPKTIEKLPTPTAEGISGRVNYDLSLSNVSNNGLGGGAVVSALTSFEHLTLEHTHVFSSNFSSSNTSRIATTLSRDFPGLSAKLDIGDMNSAAAGGASIIRGGRYFGGIRWASTGQEDPRYANLPITQIEGVAEQPSIVEIYEDNQARFGYRVEPGPFTLDVPASIAGNGDARFVVRDILGREQVVDIPFFYNGALVKEGTYAYSYEIGKNRQNFGIKDFDYGDWFAASSHRYGLTENLTLSGEAELARGYSAFGTRLATGIHAIKSSMNWALGWSESREFGDGGAASMSFQTSLLKPVSLNLFGIYKDRDFLKRSDDVTPQKLHARGGLAFPTPWLNGGLNVLYTYSKGWEGDPARFVVLNQSGKAGPVSFSLNASADPQDWENYQLNMSLSMTLGNHHASITHHFEQPPEFTTYALSRAVTRKRIGHSFSYSTDYENVQALSASLSAITDIGNANVSAFSSATNGADSAGVTMSFAGGAGFASGHLVASRPIQGAFVIAQAEGAPNVLVQANSDSAYTNDDGYALLRSLKPYHANPIRVSQESQLDVFGEAQAVDVVPYRNGGVFATIKASRGDGATVTLSANGRALPAGATISHAMTEEKMYVAEDGYAFLFSIGESAILSVSDGRRNWECTVFNPPSKDPIPDLGEVACEPVN